MVINYNECNIENKNDNDNEENKKNSAGADEVLPIIVYTLIKGNIPKLKSNINYIKLYRHSTMFDSNKEEYFTTVVESGIGFLDKIDIDSELLNISEKERENIKNKYFKNENINCSDLNDVSINNSLENNVDANYLIYNLSKSIDKEENDNNFLENKTEVTQNNLDINNININLLYQKYFNDDLKDLTLHKIDELKDDFEIVLLLLKKYLDEKKQIK